MRASTSVIVAAAITSASAQMIPGLPTGSNSSPLVSAGTQILGNLSTSCQTVLTSVLSPSSNISQCLQVPSILTLALSLDSNTSIVEPIDSYIQSICMSDPCSNATIANFTQTLLDGCSSDLEQYNIDPEYIEFAMSQYPLAREVLCLNTTTPEWDESLLNGTTSTSMSSSMMASASASTSMPAASSLVSIATAPAVSGASAAASAASLAGRQVASSLSSVAAPSLSRFVPLSAASESLVSSTSAASSAIAATSSAASAAMPSASASASSNSTNSTSCAASVLGQFEEIIGANLTTSYISAVISAGNFSAILQNITATPKTALCDDCIFGAVDLLAESWPAVVNLTITQNYTIASFLNSTCEATVAPYNVTYDGMLPETINATAANTTFAYNITSLGNNQTTNATAPTGLPNIPVFDNMNNATSSAVTSTSAMASASTAVVSTLSAAAASASSAAPSVSNIPAVKARWFGQV